ncbi:MAG: hypothetical protein ANABAC_1386 [Anaerolineae bacterium]|nr:MAG: hypothetical protein ANABAC_1386 [Anaerolineae bacterium]
MRRLTLITLALALFLVVGAALAQGTSFIPWAVLGGGGGQAEGGGISLDGTLAQPFVGTGSQGNLHLCGGFWCGEAGQSKIYLPLILRSR